jgi:hypothetical protein
VPGGAHLGSASGIRGGTAHLHLGLTSDEVEHKTEDPVDAGIDPLHGRYPVIRLLPFWGVARDGGEDAAVKRERDANDATKGTYTFRSELLAFGSAGAGKAEGRDLWVLQLP